MLPTYEDLLKDPAASSFAKDIIRAAQSRDPVDVANDLEMLAAMALKTLRLQDTNVIQPFTKARQCRKVLQPNGYYGFIFPK